MEKINLVEWQPDKQRTPIEVIDYLKDQIKSKNITKIVAVYSNDDIIGYVAGSDDRDYTKSDIFWDMKQWEQWMLNEDE